MSEKIIVTRSNYGKVQKPEIRLGIAAVLQKTYFFRGVNIWVLSHMLATQALDRCLQSHENKRFCMHFTDMFALCYFTTCHSIRIAKLFETHFRSHPLYMCVHLICWVVITLWKWSIGKVGLRFRSWIPLHRGDRFLGPWTGGQRLQTKCTHIIALQYFISEALKPKTQSRAHDGLKQAFECLLTCSLGGPI